MASDAEVARVLLAVSRGHRTRSAIAEAAGLGLTKTQTYITRLMHRNQVVSSKSPDPTERRRCIKHYHLVGITPFLLQQVWSPAE